MFISYSCLEWPQYNGGIMGGDTIVRYRIKDTDFEEVSTTIYRTYAEEMFATIIQTYSRRNLNVAYNLMLGIKVWNYNPITIEDAKQNVPEFKQYEKDVEKYLLLM